MLADATQTFIVILIVAAAVGYLGLLLRRGRRHGCCGNRSACSPDLRAGQEDPTSPVVPREDLADRARRLADEASSTDERS